VKISDPSGQTWRVSRRWVPWRRRLKGGWDTSSPDLPVGLGDDPISAVIGIIFLIIMLPFLLLALVSGLEFLLLLVVMPFGILCRVLFGQHWTIEVRRGWRPWWEAPAGNWRESALRIHDVAAEIQRGTIPQQTIPT
jgi:hypothetical protein